MAYRRGKHRFQAIKPDAGEGAKYFPEEPANIGDALNTFMVDRLSDPGQISVFESAVTDLRFRLVQLHEQMHACCYHCRKDIFSCLTQYFEARRPEWDVGPPVTGLVLVGKDDPRPAGYEPLVTRDGHEFGYAKVTMGAAAYGTILAQHEELFVDFLCSAAAGPAYWTTMLDVETHNLASNDEMFQSRWNVHQPYLYDPHPLTAARLIIFPQVFFEVFSGEDGLRGKDPEKQSLIAGMREHIQRHVLPRMPATDESTVLTYQNSNAPAPVRSIRIAFGELAGMYRHVCRCYCDFLARRLDDKYPLRLFHWWFCSAEYHRRIADLSREFAIGAPHPIPACYFDSIAGAAAARLCFDQNPGAPADALQQKARAFQSEVNNVLIPIVSETQ